MNGKKIVLTRALEQSQEFTQHLDADFIIEPLLCINYVSAVFDDFRAYDGVVVSSVHGVHQLPENRWGGDAPPFYCVGQKTAQVVQAKKYHVEMVRKTARDLSVAIVNLRDTGDKNFIYYRAKDVSFNMCGALIDVGYQVDEVITYRADFAQSFSDAFIAALEDNEIALITFFSGRTAAQFTKIINKLGLHDTLSEIHALCISDAVLGYVHPIFDKRILVADSPDASGMVSAIERFIRRSV